MQECRALFQASFKVPPYFQRPRGFLEGAYEVGLYEMQCDIYAILRHEDSAFDPLARGRVEHLLGRGELKLGRYEHLLGLGLGRDPAWAVPSAIGEGVPRIDLRVIAREPGFFDHGSLDSFVGQ
nr:hypothetical protein Iba_chr01aCG4100 [Ipomoea batatas]